MLLGGQCDSSIYLIINFSIIVTALEV